MCVRAIDFKIKKACCPDNYNNITLNTCAQSNPLLGGRKGGGGDRSWSEAPVSPWQRWMASPSFLLSCWLLRELSMWFMGLCNRGCTRTTQGLSAAASLLHQLNSLINLVYAVAGVKYCVWVDGSHQVCRWGGVKTILVSQIVLAKVEGLIIIIEVG